MDRRKKKPKPTERQAVYTTIVGGRPPGSGTDVKGIPRGIEVLIKKASVDSEFRAMLLEKRDGAAQHIGLELTAAEAALLRSIRKKQLASIISQTKVTSKSRRVFLGTAASLMLAALGVTCYSSSTQGNRPDRPPNPRPENVGLEGYVPDAQVRPYLQQPRDLTTGIRPARPPLPDPEFSDERLQQLLDPNCSEEDRKRILEELGERWKSQGGPELLTAGIRIDREDEDWPPMTWGIRPDRVEKE